MTRRLAAAILAVLCVCAFARVPLHAAGAQPAGNQWQFNDDDEKPPHNVTLSPYCIDLKEVTVADFKACSDKGKCLRASKDVWSPSGPLASPSR